jgi:hypothetical protein
MINVKQAVRAAREMLGSLFDECTLHNVRVEEVEQSDDERSWFITLGFDPTPLGRKDLIHPAREFKQFRVNAQTGKVQAMKTRKVG